MSHMKTLFTAMCAALAVIGFTVKAQAQTSSFDILGLRTGMTEQEVRGILKTIDPGMEIKVFSKRYQYSDGVQAHFTEEFVSRIFARKAQRGSPEFLNLTLRFSPPPKGGRLVGVHREEGGVQNPATGKQFRDGLVQKYGAQAIEFRSGPSGRLVWDEKGRQTCTHYTSPKAKASVPYIMVWPTASDQPILPQLEMERRQAS